MSRWIRAAAVALFAATPAAYAGTVSVDVSLSVLPNSSEPMTRAYSATEECASDVLLRPAGSDGTGKV